MTAPDPSLDPAVGTLVKAKADLRDMLTTRFNWGDDRRDEFEDRIIGIFAPLITQAEQRATAAVVERVETVPQWLRDNGMDPQEVAFVETCLRAALRTEED